MNKDRGKEHKQEDSGSPLNRGDTGGLLVLKESEIVDGGMETWEQVLEENVDNLDPALVAKLKSDLGSVKARLIERVGAEVNDKVAGVLEEGPAKAHIVRLVTPFVSEVNKSLERDGVSVSIRDVEYWKEKENENYERVAIVFKEGETRPGGKIDNQDLLDKLGGAFGDYTDQVDYNFKDGDNIDGFRAVMNLGALKRMYVVRKLVVDHDIPIIE